MNMFEKYGLKVPDVLLPNKKTDMTAWAVIACDQYTQDQDYWEQVRSITKNVHSTFHIILPEIYLAEFSASQKKDYITNIQKTMNRYLNDDIFAPAVNAMIYVERKTAYNHLRKGLIACIDLEKYSWEEHTKAEIRATEETILNRIPARMDIRRDAALELPHIMLLVNDKDNILIEKTGQYIHQHNTSPIYHVDLMINSGSISGWEIPEAFAAAHIKDALDTIYHQNKDTNGSSFMFAVGDGNHSLATAKAVWDEYKQKCGGTRLENNAVSIPQDIEHHPLRYALAEIVNLYDTGLTFEPIHRVVFDTDAHKLITAIQSQLGGTVVTCNSKTALIDSMERSKSAIGFISKDDTFICLQTEVNCLAVSALQPILDKFIPDTEKIDYIHGYDEAFRLGKHENAVAILLPPISKEDIFSTITQYGTLPRKSFSMGEASEKRFYLECRKLLQ